MKQFNASTLAGTPVAGNVDGYYEYAQFSRPCGIHIISDFIFVSDRSIGSSIRVLHGGRVQSIRFNNKQELLRAGGITSLVIESKTLLFIADLGHDKIRYLTLPEHLTQAWFDTLASNKIELQTLTIQSKLKGPASVLAVSQNRLLIADTQNSRVLRISVSFNSYSPALQVSNIDVLCQIERPEGLALYEGLILIADSLSHAVYSFNAQTKKLQVFCGGRVGTRDGPAQSAEFKGPCAVQCLGNRVYVLDRDSGAIREVYDGKVRTISGARGPGYADGIPQIAQFKEPRDLLVIQSTYFTKLIICDCMNSCIRELVDTSAFQRAHQIDKTSEHNDEQTDQLEITGSETEIDLGNTDILSRHDRNQENEQDKFMSSDILATKAKLREREKLLKEREILIQKVNTIESELEDVVKEIDNSGMYGPESQNLEEEETLLSSSIYQSQQVETQNEEQNMPIVQNRQNVMKKDFIDKPSGKKKDSTNYRIEPYDTLNRLIPSSKANPGQFYQYFSREPYDPELLLEYLLQFNISSFVAISFGYLDYLHYADVLKQKITVSAGQIRNVRALSLFRSIVTHQLLNYSPPVISSLFTEPAQHASCLATAHHNCVKLRIGVAGQCFKLNQNNQFLFDIVDMKIGPRNVADLKEVPMWFELQVVSELQHHQNITSQVQFTKGMISDSKVHQVVGIPYVWHKKQFSIFFHRFEYMVDVQRLQNAIGIFQQIQIEVWDQFKIKIGIEAGRGTQKRSNQDLARSFALEQCSVAVFV